MDRKFADRLVKTAYSLAACFLAGTLLSAAFLVNARISGESMLPGLEDGDMCTGPKGAAGVSYGSIVIVDDRDNGRILVKRVIGMGGDEIIVLPDGHVERNGEPVDEPYILEQDGGAAGTYSVPEGSVFVLGDNRGQSSDSRRQSLGCVDESRIIGTVSFRFWPPGRAGFLD